MDPVPTAVATMPAATAATRPKATGTSMCGVRVRTAATALVRKIRPGHATASTASATDDHWKNSRNARSMSASSPPYSAKATAIALLAIAPATPIRTIHARLVARSRRTASGSPKECSW